MSNMLKSSDYNANIAHKAASFESLGLCSQLISNVHQQGYAAPTPVQIRAIPVVLAKKDVMAIAQTGTGKTASFTLPILQHLLAGTPAQPKHIKALIIAPTRELAAQVAKSVSSYTQDLPISACPVFGGVRIEPQILALQQGVDIVIATVGRLRDLYNQNAICFDSLEILVLDEADRMLDLGFIDDITFIQALLPKQRQTLMFSATFPATIKALAKNMLRNPVVVEVHPKNQSETSNGAALHNIKQILHPVDHAKKNELLIHLLKQYQWPQVLVFCKTKRGADTLVSQLESKGFSADSIHANRTQRARTLALAGFKGGSLAILVATDIAARGLDIVNLPCVINLDLPYVPEDYVHRIGRTGRAGAYGLAISFASTEEAKQLKAIEREVGLKLLPEPVLGFEPTVVAPVIEVDEELYGNFESNTTHKLSKQKKRGRRGRR